ncbi:MAG: F0F1 ATP synthase subunit A [Pseudomonadota bacterium]|nr:F0F1 ATP synthase subunit A [Pseudomonadota bacterium]
MISLLGLLLAGTSGAQASSFSWYQLIPGFGQGGEVGHALGLHDAHEAFLIPTVWGIVALLLGLAFVARLGVQRALAKGGTAAYVPDAGLTVRNVFEIIVEWLYDLVAGMVGKTEAKAFLPLIATLFLYVLFSNLSGFIPGVLPATENFSHNLALALCVFVVFNYAGLSRQGFGYIKHLAGPVALLAPAFLLLETISLLIRPISLTVRLSVNIFVDHLLQTIVRGLGDSFLGFLGAAVLPVPIYFLGLLVCVVQAFVFALLTTIYISLSVAHSDEHHH